MEPVWEEGVYYGVLNWGMVLLFIIGDVFWDKYDDDCKDDDEDIKFVDSSVGFFVSEIPKLCSLDGNSA